MDPDAEKRRITRVLVLWVVWAIVLIVGDVILLPRIIHFH
jgi:hypothetical protein